MIAYLTRVAVVNTFATPDAAVQRFPYPKPQEDSNGAGGGIAFSYDVHKMITLGAAGDLMSTNTHGEMRGRFFSQDIDGSRFMKTGRLHSLFKVGRVLEGAVKHSSSSGDGDGDYFWSYGCPQQGGGFQFSTQEGQTADKDFWEERTGTRWLLRVPQTSIKLAVEYEHGRGNYSVSPDSAYSADVFNVPGECGYGEAALINPRVAYVLDDMPVDHDYRENMLTAGASLTLWFGRRPLSLATEYESWTQEWEEAVQGAGTRDLSMLKLGAELGATRKVTVRVGGVWGEDRVARDGVSSALQRPLEGGWTEKSLTLGGTYVLAPGLRQIEVAYLYTSREPDFDDLYARDATDHRLTAYARFYF
jgi:hypothetical protein